MNEPVSRVRRDLEIMEQAVGLRLPFDRGDVRRVALGSLLAAPLALFGLLGPSEPPYPGAAIVVTLLAVLVFSWVAAARSSRERHTEPARWREEKKGLVLWLALTSLLLAYLVVGLWGGLSWHVVLPTAVFVGGVAMGVPAVIDRASRSQLGAGLATIAYAAAIPFCDDVGLVFATSGWLALAGLSTALWMHCQLKADESA